MSFTRVVCWESERAEQVMRTDADAAQAPVFMAVHTEEPLSFERPAGQRSAQEFLEDFITRSGDVRAVVIGDSGYGKSHLVRWVELNIPRDRTDLRVVSVPRSGTSLRWIVGRLIEVLPPALRAEYQDKLVAAPDSASEFTELELGLLTGLALSLDRSEHSNEVDAALANGLRDFFLDPSMREHHSGEKGIVADLVRHITTASGREDRETRRRFEEADLHLDAAMTRMRDLAAPTVHLLRSLQGNAQLRERAVELVNAHLDAAVAQTLGLGSGDLTDLLNGIRRHLREKGQTLVLLVEDFVRTEGIDRALLDALIESSDELCQMRLLIAVTTGYYRSELLATQKTRLDFIINLDQRSPLDEGDRLAPFAARYLNALRVGDRTLHEWYAETRTGETRPPLPNACTECEHREPCHATFGSRSLQGAGEVGLYPFTSHALSNMAQRWRDRSPNSAAMDPRSLLRDILRPIVSDLRSQSLRRGDFPDSQLVENHGGRELEVGVQRQVRDRTGPQADRYLALLELWSSRPGDATQLPDELYAAFTLDPLMLGEDPPTEPQPHSEVEPEVEHKAEVPQAVQRRLGAIQTWANNGPMTGVTDNLRRLVMNAVMAAIDWDREELERAVFAGSRGTASDAFARTSIDFARQDTREVPRAVKLRLPLDGGADSQLRAAQALQGLVNFEHHGHWNFPGGLNQLLAVSEQVPTWAEHVVDQLGRVHDPDREWDPVASAVEVLAVGGALASKPAQLDASPAQRLAAILDEEWPDPREVEVRSDLWRDLYGRIHARRGELRELVLAHASAMKGGQAGSMLDARRVVGPLRAVSRDWQLRSGPPERLAEADLPDRYRRLFDLHTRVSERLGSAAEDEVAQRLAWLDALREYIPAGVVRREVVQSIEQLQTALHSASLSVRSDYLATPLDSFRTVQLDEAIRMTEELRSVEGSAQALLPRLAGERRGEAMRSAERFRDPVMRFLDDTESKVRSEKERIGGAREVEEQYARIDAGFAELEKALELVTGP